MAISTKPFTTDDGYLNLDESDAMEIPTSLPGSLVCRRLRTRVRTETLDPDATLALIENVIQALNFFQYVAMPTLPVVMPTLPLPEHLGDAIDKLSGVMRLLKVSSVSFSHEVLDDDLNVGTKSTTSCE
jgi:hypothetical protein